MIIIPGRPAEYAWILLYKNIQSGVVCKMTRLRVGPSRIRSSSPGSGKRFLFYSKSSRPTLMSNQSPVNWVPEYVPRG